MDLPPAEQEVDIVLPAGAIINLRNQEAFKANISKFEIHEDITFWVDHDDPTFWSPYI